MKQNTKIIDLDGLRPEEEVIQQNNKQAEKEKFLKQLEGIQNALTLGLERVVITIENEILKKKISKLLVNLKKEVEEYTKDLTNIPQMVEAQQNNILAKLTLHKNRIELKINQIGIENTPDDKEEARSLLKDILYYYSPKKNLYKITANGEIGSKESALYHSQKILISDENAHELFIGTMKKIKKAMGNICYSCFISMHGRKIKKMVLIGGYNHF